MQNAMPLKRYLLSIFAALLLAIVISAWIVLTAPQEVLVRKEAPAVHVLTTIVSQQDMQPLILLKGQFKPAQRAWLRFEISGPVIERLAEPGQSVQDGDLLLRIKEGDLRDTLAQTQAELKAEQSAVRRDQQLHKLLGQQESLAQQEVERLKQLQQDALASTSNYEQAQRDLLQLQIEQERLAHGVRTTASRLAMLQSKRDQAERNWQRSRLLAPFPGVINQVTVEVGDYANPSMNAVELVNIDELDLHLNVPGSIAVELQRGHKVDLQADGGRHVGRVVAIESSPDRHTHTHALRIRVTANQALYPGQIAEALLPGRMLHSVAVTPATAVLREEGGSYVFRIMENLSLRQLPVRILWQQDGLTALEGIKPGVRIVADNVSDLSSSQTVIPTPAQGLVQSPREPLPKRS